MLLGKTPARFMTETAEGDCWCSGHEKDEGVKALQVEAKDEGVKALQEEESRFRRQEEERRFRRTATIVTSYPHHDAKAGCLDDDDDFIERAGTESDIIRSVTRARPGTCR